MKLEQEMDETITEIAKRQLRISTLEVRNSDRLDFHEIGVVSIKRALEAAFLKGFHLGKEQNEN